MSAPSIRQRSRPQPAGVDQAIAAPPLGDEYKVGYRRPPLDTRFGAKHGNRSGRKAGSKTFEAAIEKELGSRVNVTIAGKQCNVSKLEVLALNMVNSAIAGKAGPQKILFDYLHRRDQTRAAKEAAEHEPDEVELSPGQEDAVQLLTRLLSSNDQTTGGDQ